MANPSRMGLGGAPFEIPQGCWIGHRANSLAITLDYLHFTTHITLRQGQRQYQLVHEIIFCDVFFLCDGDDYLSIVPPLHGAQQIVARGIFRAHLSHLEYL